MLEDFLSRAEAAEYAPLAAKWWHRLGLQASQPRFVAFRRAACPAATRKSREGDASQQETRAKMML